MQLSTNSNKQIEWLVKAQPTPIGQHRQAYLQRLDREQALLKAQFDLRKHEANVEIKEAEIAIQARDIEKAEQAGDMEVACYFKSKLKLMKIELEEMTAGLKYINVQVADAHREMTTADLYMKEACAQAGIDFETLDEETYQTLLSENVMLTTGRRLSAQTLAPITGLPASVIETLAEMPEGDRQQMLSQIPYITALVEKACVGILNPVSNLKELSHAY